MSTEPMGNYTPTTEYVRDFYAKFNANLGMHPGYDDEPYDAAEAEFDRWLAATIRAAQDDARADAASKLASVVGFWRADPDNWRFENECDTRNWLLDVASDIRAGRPVVLTDEPDTRENQP